MRSLLSQPSLAALLLAWLAPGAHAEDAITVGAIRDADLRVVQQVLYPKADRAELGVHLGMMPFDAFLKTPNLQASYDLHRSDTWSISGVGGLGWGIKSAAYRELEGPTFQVAPYAYRYLASALGGVAYAPLYGKMSVDGARVFHWDGYLAGRAGLTLEPSVIPGGGLALSPTVSLGVGARVFTGPNRAIRVELRDDLLVQHRKLTGTTHLKQNANLTVGVTRLSNAEKGR